MNSLFGWKDLSPTIRSWFNNLDRAVILFPHTSRWDIFTILSYTMTYTELHNRIWVMIRRYWINMIANEHLYSKYFRMLEAPTPDERKDGSRGFINRALETFRNIEKYLIFISPEGDVTPKPWKSGYWILARELEIPIAVVGFDYVEHRIKTPILIKPDWKTLKNTGTGKIYIEYPENNRDNYYINSDWELLHDDIQSLAKNAMKTIIPLRPNKSYIPIEYSVAPTSVGITTKIILVLIIILIIIIIALIICRQMNYKKPSR